MSFKYGSYWTLSFHVCSTIKDMQHELMKLISPIVSYHIYTLNEVATVPVDSIDVTYSYKSSMWALFWFYHALISVLNICCDFMCVISTKDSKVSLHIQCINFTKSLWELMVCSKLLTTQKSRIHGAEITRIFSAKDEAKSLTKPLAELSNVSFINSNFNNSFKEKYIR